MNPLLKIACEFAAASLQGQRQGSQAVNHMLAWKDAQRMIETMPEPFRAAMAVEIQQHETKDAK